jgi:hypothetical protein
MIPVVVIPLLVKIAGHVIDYAFKKINEMPAEKAAPVLEKVKKDEEKKKAKQVAKENKYVQW